MSDYFRNYSEKDMEIIKKELSEVDIDLSVISDDKEIGLKPLNWHEGDIAISPSHFYTVYTDPKEGLTVHSTNRVTGSADKCSNFSSRADAHDWIKNTHYAAKREQYDKTVAEYGISIGQEWVNKSNSATVIQIIMIESSHVYTNLLFESKNFDISMIKNDISSFIPYLKRDFFLMLEDETAADCLARHETGVNHVVTTSA